MFGSKVGNAVAGKQNCFTKNEWSPNLYLAGNAIIIKSSEKAPLTPALLAGLTKEAGFPDGLIQLLSGMGDTGKLLAEHPKIRKVSFTGSTRTGRHSKLELYWNEYAID